MAEVGTRLRWRDVLALAVLAAIIIGGLVHYGRGLGADEHPLAHGRRGPAPPAPPPGVPAPRGPARAREPTADRPGRTVHLGPRHLLGRPRDHGAQAVRAARRC